ncbi:MAG: cell division protein FtsA, partial [Bacteroidota bacterium]|nr:cell division protein FtsA [Bacteroidota bacterium]
GTTKVVVFIAKKNENGEIEIIGRGKTVSTGVINGDVTVITSTAQSIRQAVEQAERESGYRVEEVFVGVAGYNIQTQRHRSTRIIEEDNHIITNEDVQDMINELYNINLPHGKQIVDIVPQNYSVDGTTDILDPVGRIGKSVECNYNLISADVNNINNITRSVEMAGYKVKNLILQPIASSEAAIDDMEKNGGVCLVDIGGGTTDVAIYHEGILRFTSVIQLAGNAITNDIKEGCNILKPQAEALKIKYGSCLPDSKEENDIISIPGFRGQDNKQIQVITLSRIINERVKMILELVHYDIKTSGYEQKLIAGIVLTGGGAMIKNIVNLTEYLTGIPTRIGESDSNIAKISDQNSDIRHPMYATGVGLVIKGFEYYEENDCFVEEEIKETENQKEESEPKEEKHKKKNTKENNKEKGLLSKIRKVLDGILSNGVQ